MFKLTAFRSPNFGYKRKSAYVRLMRLVHSWQTVMFNAIARQYWLQLSNDEIDVLMQRQHVHQPVRRDDMYRPRVDRLAEDGGPLGERWYLPIEPILFPVMHGFPDGFHVAPPGGARPMEDVLHELLGLVLMLARGLNP